MLQNASHTVGTRDESEILYDTDFGYMFEYLCGCGHHLLPSDKHTVRYLKELGKVMADPGSEDTPMDELDSDIPAIYTYLGQFIDHDITARTDRETGFSDIGDEDDLRPLDPNDILQNLRNGRRPQLDLDSVFGEGPSLNQHYTAQADEEIYNNTSLNIFLEEDDSTGYIDLRRNDGVAQIADARNDENVMVSQLQATFIKMYNTINDELEPGLSNEAAYCKARRLCRWAYQYVVINDYLQQVCDPNVVHDIMLNGPYFFKTGSYFMPLEFSVAGFRFGHSMIRHSYKLNDHHTKGIMELLQPSNPEQDLLDGGQLKADHVIDWSNFANVGSGSVDNKARKIDPFIAQGLFDLSSLEAPPPPHVLASLTQRNLLRGYLLNIPTGQAIAKAMRIEPMRHEELVKDLNEEQKCVMYDSGFTAKTPLWYYVLQEAKVQQEGNRLGYVGSKLVAETIAGLVKMDQNSYYNNQQHPRVDADKGITLPGSSTPIQTIADILEYAGVA